MPNRFGRSGYPGNRFGRRLLIQGEGNLLIYDAEGTVEWKMPWGPIHDLHVGVNGNFWVQQGISTVAEIDPETKKVIWSYESAVSNGNQGKRVEVHSFQPLDDDRIMIAESGPARVIEINRKGELLAEMRLTVDHPDAHSDTRLVRKLPTGAYLVCHERDGVVREYDSDSGAVMWSYEIPLFGKPRKDGHGPEAFGNKVFGALRLTNGNTLIATGNGHSVIEVTPDREIVWKIEQNDLPGVRLAWVTTLEVTAQGTYVVGNCHAGPKQPLLVEVDPKTKKVVATFDRFDELGNSVSNSKLLAAPKRTS